MSGLMDESLRPSVDERTQLQRLVSSTKRGAEFTEAERTLLWKFRFSLKDDKKALVKFLYTVDWRNEAEVQSAVKLLPQWAAIDVDDALLLLSAEFRHPHVRSFAVAALDRASDEDLQCFLLQVSPQQAIV